MPIFKAKTDESKPKEQRAEFKTLRDFNDFTVADERLRELQTELSETQQRVSELESLIGENDDGRETREKAAALVQGDSGDAFAQVEARKELREAEEQAAILTEAVKLQREIIRNATAEAQHAMARERLPEHKKLIARVGAAFEQLKSAVQDEADFCEQLKADGGRFSSPLVAMKLDVRLGTMNNKFEVIDMWFSRMERHGYL